MRLAMQGIRGRRNLVIVAVAAGLLVASGGAAHAATRSSSPACTDTWTGGGPKVLWGIAQNWSAGRVPGAADDVCMTAFAFVTASGPVHVHSLHVGSQMTVIFQGLAARPSHVTITGALDDLGNVDLDNTSLSASSVGDSNGINAQGTSVLTTPALRVSGTVSVVDGKLTLADPFAQLSDGTLHGGTWDAYSGTLVLPGDITSLPSGLVSLGRSGTIDDPAGHAALAGLTSVGAHAGLAVSAASLSLTGSLTASGNLQIGSYDLSGGSLTVAGTLTQAQGNLTMSAGTLTARTVVIDHGAALGAGGTIDGNLVNHGSAGPAYHLNVTGSYTQTAGAALDAGFVPELQVAGPVTLAGALFAGDTPAAAPGTRRTAITFSSLAGGFTSHNLGFTIATEANEIDVIARPQIAPSARAVAGGTPMTISGGDFAYGSTVTLSLDRAGGTLLGTAQPSIQGNFDLPVTIPASVPAGSHKVIAVGSDGRRAATTITVT
jgi:hypothetical protein